MLIDLFAFFAVVFYAIGLLIYCGFLIDCNLIWVCCRICYY